MNSTWTICACCCTPRLSSSPWTALGPHGLGNSDAERSLVRYKRTKRALLAVRCHQEAAFGLELLTIESELSRPQVHGLRVYGVERYLLSTDKIGYGQGRWVRDLCMSIIPLMLGALILHTSHFHNLLSFIFMPVYSFQASFGIWQDSLSPLLARSSGLWTCYSLCP